MMIDTPRAPPLKAMLACDICGYTYEKPCLYIAINETWREFDHTAEVVLHRPIFRFNEAAVLFFEISGIFQRPHPPQCVSLQ